MLSFLTPRCPQGPTADVATLAASLQAAADRSTCGAGLKAAPGSALGGAFTGVFDKFKCRLTVTGLGHGAGPLELLDAAKSADVVLAVLSAGAGPEGAVDDEGLRRAAVLRAHGMPAAVGYLQHLPCLGAKHLADFKRRATRFMADEFGEHAKVVAGTPAPLPFAASAAPAAAVAFGAAGGMVEAAPRAGAEDMDPLLRVVSTLPHRTLKYREDRPYLLAASIAVLAEPLGSDTLALAPAISPAAAAAFPGGAEALVASAVPVLAVSGYLRGAPLNVNQLVHVPGLGARRILRILAPVDPCPAKILRGPVADAAAAAAHAVAAQGGALLASGDAARCEPLQCAATPDGLHGEQTWPEDAEYVNEGGSMGDGEEGAARAKARRPAGVSDYQATWLGSDGEDDDEDDDAGSDGGDDDEEDGGAAERGDVLSSAKMVDLGSAAGLAKMRHDKLVANGEEDDGQFSFLQSDDGLNLAGLDAVMTEAEAAAERDAARRRRAAEDMDFPDEVDAPYDQPARERFAR